MPFVYKFTVCTVKYIYEEEIELVIAAIRLSTKSVILAHMRFMHKFAEL